MFDVPFPDKEPPHRSPILLGSEVSIILTDESGSSLHFTLQFSSRPVRHCTLDTVYRRAVNIAAGIDDLEGVSVGLAIVYTLPTIASMFDCIVVVYKLLDGPD